VHVGDSIDASEPRGSFILQSGERPVVLISAGIGATPVLAMLQTLAAARSTRPVFWLHGARDRAHHPFAEEVRRALPQLAHPHSYVCYSRPAAQDAMQRDFDASGHLSQAALTAVGMPTDADVYVCGPARFMTEMRTALAAVGVPADRIHVELFVGSEPLMPGVVGAATAAPHLPAGD